MAVQDNSTNPAFTAGLGDVNLGGYRDADRDYVTPAPAAPAPIPENDLDYSNPDA